MGVIGKIWAAAKKARAAFARAFAQDDFRGDWYGYLTNQVSHIGLGVALAVAVSFAGLHIWGEYPIKLHAWALILAVYVSTEVLRGWSGWDSAEDTAFVTYGATGVFLVFREIAPGNDALIAHAGQAVFLVILAGGHLAGGVATRMRRR